MQAIRRNRQPRPAARQRQPAARQRRHMQPVVGVVMTVFKINKGRLIEEGARIAKGADTRGDNGEGRGRKRRIMRGNRLVIGVIGRGAGRGHVDQPHRQRLHHIALLAHLRAEQFHRVMVEQQRPTGHTQRRLEGGLGKEAVVLRVDTQRRVNRQPHRLCRPRPCGNFGVIQPDTLCQSGRALYPGRCHLSSKGQMRTGGGVGIEIIVDKGRVFVGAGHAVDAKGARTRRIKATDIDPDPRCFEKHFCRCSEKRRIARCIRVELERAGDVGVDVILRGARRIMRGTLAPGDGTPRI